MSAATAKAAMAILHHCIYKQRAKLNKAVNSIDVINFICVRLIIVTY